MKIPCSVPILTLNCLPVLQRTLPLLAETFADVFIVDGNSTDGTQDYARSLGVRVEKQFDTDEQNQRITDFRATRLRSWSMSREAWLFAMDADELLTSELIEAIRRIVERNERHTVHSFKRYIKVDDGRIITHTPFYSNVNIRLFPLGIGVDLAPRKVHERLIIPAGISIIQHNEAIICPEPDPMAIARRSRRYVELEASSEIPVTWPYFWRWIIWYNLQSLIGQLARVAWFQMQNVLAGRPSLPWAYNLVFLRYRWWSLRAQAKAWRAKRRTN